MLDNEMEIVLVEDNPGDLELTLHTLRQNHVANPVQVCRDGEEALDFVFCRGRFAASAFLSPPKLVLLDVNLPKISGLEVLSILKTDSRTAAVPVIVLTSSERERKLIESRRLAVDGYVRKPVNFRELQQALAGLSVHWLLASAPGSLLNLDPQGRSLSA